jgi:hypothetical protein
MRTQLVYETNSVGFMVLRHGKPQSVSQIVRRDRTTKKELQVWENILANTSRSKDIPAAVFHTAHLANQCIDNTLQILKGNKGDFIVVPLTRVS